MPLCSNQLSSNLAYFKLRIPAPTQVSLSLSTHMRMLACAHGKSSGQRIKFKPCKITMTACQAVVYEIRFTFFFLSLFGNQGSEIDLTSLEHMALLILQSYRLECCFVPFVVCLFILSLNLLRFLITSLLKMINLKIRYLLYIFSYLNYSLFHLGKSMSL